jgi:hypothetical protein
MSEHNSYTTKRGDYLVVSIEGYIPHFIAQVTREVPLYVKVKETGPLSNIGPANYVVLEEETSRFQNDHLRNGLLKERKDAGRPLISGLRSLGVTDDDFYEFLPTDTPKPN